jgi:DNA-binding PadR family transcriptional regulator
MYTAVMGIETELKKGSIQTLILAVLSSGPLHGYGIAREIEKRSADVLSFNEGALYPALRSLEREELVVGDWQVQERGPARRVYELSGLGKKRLAEHAVQWEKFSNAVGSVLAGSSVAIGGTPNGLPA